MHNDDAPGAPSGHVGGVHCGRACDVIAGALSETVGMASRPRGPGCHGTSGAW